MAEGIVTPDGTPVDIDPAEADKIEQTFAKAMGDPDPGQEKAPPRRAEKPQGGSGGQDKPRVKRGPRQAPQGSTGPKKTAPVVSRADRVNAVKGLVQLSATGCVLASSRVKNPVPFQADAVVLVANSDQLAEAVADTAANDARFAALVDKIATAGPYASLVTVTFAIGAQMARNHGVPIPGMADPGDIVKSATEAEMAAAA
jgi:hypothetical protein